MSMDEPLGPIHYDRLCRTPNSEAYLLSEGEQPLCRVDLHFGTSMVHGLLVVERELDEDALRALMERIDDDLVWTADQPRDDFLLTVYRGQEIGVYSDTEPEDEEYDEDEDESTER